MAASPKLPPKQSGGQHAAVTGRTPQSSNVGSNLEIPIKRGTRKVVISFIGPVKVVCGGDIAKRIRSLQAELNGGDSVSGSGGRGVTLPSTPTEPPAEQQPPTELEQSNE